MSAAKLLRQRQPIEGNIMTNLTFNVQPEITCASDVSEKALADAMDKLRMNDFVVVPSEASKRFYNARYRYFNTRAFSGHKTPCGGYTVIRKLRGNVKRFDSLKDKQLSREK